MTSKPILCLDFDGVLHSYISGWQGADVVGDPPVPGAMAFVFEAVKYFRVAVYSSRSSDPRGIDAMREWTVSHMFRYCGMEARLVLDNVEWPTTKPPALVTIDDRALTFNGRWPSVDSLLLFKPWNKAKVKLDWVARSATVADELIAAIGRRCGQDPDLAPRRCVDTYSRECLELPHLLFMAVELREMRLDSETKACRWLGFLQAGLVNLGVITLEEAKELNLTSGELRGKES